MTTRSGPLSGLRVLEIEGIGPAPFCGMLLADLGADVVVVERLEPNPQNAGVTGLARMNRGKRSVAVDLKSPQGVEQVLQLAGVADVLIEGMRPGVMERLGLGPDVCLARNPRLVFGRVTGWGQSGPLAQAAGHDLNYVALAGALWYAGQAGEPPLTPPSVVGDIAAGALYLTVGVLAAAMNARTSGRGQVVDAAIVDGAAHLLSLLLALQPDAERPFERGTLGIDGAHWYQSYRCADGRYVTVGAVEPKFYALLLAKLGLAADPAFADPAASPRWPELRQRFAAIFSQRTQREWCELLEGTDACFAPVLAPDEAEHHPHVRARGVYYRADGALQANPAPRFSATPPTSPGPVPRRGADTAAVLEDWLRPAAL